MKILQIANGDFFTTYGGGQIYVKSVVDEMIRQNLDVAVVSFVNKKSGVTFQKQNYKNIDLYEIYQKDETTITSVIQQIKPDIIHIHAEKVLLAKISHKLAIPNVVTAHHGGIVCPGGSLLNYKDEICKVPATHKNCMRCVLRNVKCGRFFYPFLKMIPLSVRLKIGRIISKLPFIYFITPILNTNLYIEKKQKAWKSIVQNTDKMIAPSIAIADNMVMNGFPREKITLLPHGIPIYKMEKGCRSNKPLKFFNLGGTSYEKGLHILLAAFSQINPQDCELHIIGNITYKKVQRIIHPYLKRKNIFFYGKLPPEKIMACVRNFDVLIHSAIYLEVFGLNISEALSQKKTVIATRCGGAEMQISNGENGLLIEPNSVDELKNAIQWIINHPEERHKMSENADKNVISLQKHIQQLITIYNNG